MKSLLLNLIKSILSNKNPFLRYKFIISNIFSNWQVKRRYNKGNIKDTCGSSIEKMGLEKTLNSINRAFENYLLYSKLSQKDFYGKKILEIGPGDNLGVALKFLSAGATKCVCIDKFYPVRSLTREYELYKALRLQLDDISKNNFDKAIDLTRGIQINPKKLRYINGTGIEEAKDLLKFEKFDFIVSSATLEHIYKIDSAFSIMDKILSPGGYMIHWVDFKPHSLFPGMHPLTFLTVPDYLYRLMTKDSGKPNRKLINYYRLKMKDLGYSRKIFITKILTKKFGTPKSEINFNFENFKHSRYLIREIRPKLFKTFKNMSDEDLMIRGIVLVAKKQNNYLKNKKI